MTGASQAHDRSRRIPDRHSHDADRATRQPTSPRAHPPQRPAQKHQSTWTASNESNTYLLAVVVANWSSGRSTMPTSVLARFDIWPGRDWRRRTRSLGWWRRRTAQGESGATRCGGGTGGGTTAGGDYDTGGVGDGRRDQGIPCGDRNLCDNLGSSDRRPQAGLANAPQSRCCFRVLPLALLGLFWSLTPRVCVS